MTHWKNFDRQLLALPLVVVGFGTIMLYEISRWAPTVPTTAPYKQLAYLLIGLILFWLFTNFDYRSLHTLAWPAYGAMIAGLIFVSLIGHSSFGATRWINLGFIQLQPSEPAKLVVVLTLARFLTDRAEAMNRVTTIVGAIVIAGIPAVLVLREPDFGSAMVFVAVWVVLMVMGATPVRYMVALVSLAAVAAPVAWLKVLQSYQRDRLTSFLHPNSDLRTTNFGPFHAQLAIGSGGPWGEWFSRSTQSRLNFLQVQDKDYIFSVIAEQVGFFGVVIIFAVFMALLLRIARVAFLSADSFGRLIAGGLLTIFLFQTFVNIGMNMGIMPVTGIPLPFLSYGGSSLITSMAALGILESILLRRQKLVFGRGQSML